MVLGRLRNRCPVCGNKMVPCIHSVEGCPFWLCLDCPLGWDQAEGLAHSKHEH